MNGTDGGTILLRAAVWGSIYLLLAAGRYWWERWLMAHFQGRRARPPVLPPPMPLRSGGQILAGALGLLAGAAVPLAPAVRVAGAPISLHLATGQLDAFYPLAALWTGSILLAVTAQQDRWGRRQLDRTAARVLSGVLPVLLAGLSLAITSGLVNPDREGTLHLATLIDLQGGWAGWRWFGVLQPVAAAVWMICALPVHPGAQARTGFGWQLVLLAHTLLTGALCWGGWQGPWVERLPWLGLIYTTVKLGAVTLAWTWLEVRLADKSHTAWIHMSGPVLVSLGIANLVLTGLVTIVR